MKNANEKRVPKTITLDAQIHDKLQGLSRDKNLPASLIIEKLLDQYFDKKEVV